MIDERLASTLLDASPDGMLVVDADGVIRLSNRAAEQLFGHGPGQLVGRQVDELVPLEQRGHHAELRDQYVESPSTRPMGSARDLFAEHSDGTLFPVDISLSTVDLDGETSTIATVRDVTQRRHEAAQIELLRDRERIARDLHDMVIQRLFGSGLGLQAVLGAAQPAYVRERIIEVVDELDATIRELRGAIFELSERPSDSPLTDRIVELMRERSKVIGFEPTLHTDNAVDEVTDDVGEQLLATMGEALTNVAKHAAASTCAVRVTNDGTTVHLTVVDDGVGLPAEVGHRGGLNNMADRAQVLGGTCTVEALDEGGTVVDWSVPV